MRSIGELRWTQPAGTLNAYDHVPRRDAADFEHLLGRSSTAHARAQSPRDSNADAQALAARAAAEKLVAIALIQPVLKQLRESNMATGPFAPTQGEKLFQSLADAQTAERIAHATHFPLVDRIAEQVLRKAPPASTQGGAS